MGFNHLQQVKPLFPYVSFFGKKVKSHRHTTVFIVKYFLNFSNNVPQSKLQFGLNFPPRTDDQLQFKSKTSNENLSTTSNTED